MEHEPVHIPLERMEQVRKQIEREIADLERRMRAGDQALEPVPLDPGAVGRLSRIDELQNQAMARGLREREDRRLNELHATLRRIDEGTYGTCERCGRPIPGERIEA